MELPRFLFGNSPFDYRQGKESHLLDANHKTYKFQNFLRRENYENIKHMSVWGVRAAIHPYSTKGTDFPCMDIIKEY